MEIFQAEQLKAFFSVCVDEVPPRGSIHPPVPAPPGENSHSFKRDALTLPGRPVMWTR